MQREVEHDEDTRCSRSDRPTIRASEVGDYAYCARSWWLKRVRGEQVTSSAATQGIEVHAAVAREIATVVRAGLAMRALAWGTVLVGLILLIALLRG